MMYQTATISNRIVSLGSRSYRQRLEAMSGNVLTCNKLGRLNKDLDDLYELLLAKFNSISADEVKAISPLLEELLKTVKDLHDLGLKMNSSIQIEEELNHLALNYSALQEIFEDMQNFRLPSEFDSELKAMLAKAANLMKSVS